jgi:late competence protein required for DNA uptake (superfamily II DNA/RNA helicase)
MQNSDLVYHNELNKIFKDKLFTLAVKQKHMQDIRKTFKFENIMKNNKACEDCTNNFTNWFSGLYSNRVYCEYCMNFVCKDCLHKPD